MEQSVVEEAGVLKSINGFTWPGIEYGEAPSCQYTFFQYVDALRAGDLAAFQEIEAASAAWWNVDLDRGAGAALHFAVDAGQLGVVRFLIEHRGARVNQQSASTRQTPLHNCARMAHNTHTPFLQIFEYLLAKGADASLRCRSDAPELTAGALPTDMAVQQGRGWEPGQVRATLQGLIECHTRVPKQARYVYSGPGIGEQAAAVMAAWQQLPPRYPPANWRAPPAAGFLDASGMRPVSSGPWQPATQNDASCFMRPMTDGELAEQSRRVAALG